MDDLTDMLAKLARRHPRLRQDIAPVVAGLQSRVALVDALAELSEITELGLRRAETFSAGAPSVPLGRLVDRGLQALSDLFGPLRFSDTRLKRARAAYTSALLGMQAVASDFEDGRVSAQTAAREMAEHAKALDRASVHLTKLAQDPRYAYLVDP